MVRISRTNTQFLCLGPVLFPSAFLEFPAVHYVVPFIGLIYELMSNLNFLSVTFLNTLIPFENIHGQAEWKNKDYRKERIGSASLKSFINDTHITTLTGQPK